MGAYTIFSVLFGIASPFIGGLIDRYGAKRIISAGALIGCLGFLSLSQLQNIWHFYASYIIIAFSMAAIGPVPATATVSSYFQKRKGTALGIMSVGIGVGMLVMAPLIGGYLLPTFGWRVSYLVLAFIMLTLLPLALFLIKAKPAATTTRSGNMESSDVNIEVRLPETASNGLNLKAALGTTAFWLIAFSFFSNGFSVIGTSQNQALHIQDLGYSLEIAAYTITAMGIGSAIGKFLFGWLCDVIPVRYACAISFLFLAGATIILLYLKPGTPLVVLWVYGVILGLGGGGWLPTMSIFISTNFGQKSYGSIFGTIILIQNMGTALGPLFAGSLFDIANTYQWAFITFLVLYAMAIPATLLIRRPQALVTT